MLPVVQLKRHLSKKTIPCQTSYIVGKQPETTSFPQSDGAPHLEDTSKPLKNRTEIKALSIKPGLFLQAFSGTFGLTLRFLCTFCLPFHFHLPSEVLFLVAASCSGCYDVAQDLENSFNISLQKKGFKRVNHLKSKAAICFVISMS